MMILGVLIYLHNMLSAQYVTDIFLFLECRLVVVVGNGNRDLDINASVCSIFAEYANTG